MPLQISNEELLQIPTDIKQEEEEYDDTEPQEEEEEATPPANNGGFDFDPDFW